MTSQKVIIRTQRGIDITFDVEGSVSISDNSSITTSPTAIGTTFSDHIYREPTTCSLSGKMSNLFIVGNSGYSDSDRVSKTIKLLKEIKNAGETIEIITRFSSLSNQLITSISENTDGRSSNSIDLTLNTNEIIVSSVRTTTIEVNTSTTEEYLEASDYLEDGSEKISESDEESFAEVLGGAIAGAGAGALIGSWIPVVGVPVGALVGGLIGGIGVIIDNAIETKNESRSD